MGRKRKHRHRTPKLTFHHYYPRPFRNLDHTPKAGEYIDNEFHRWIHANYSNYELAHSYCNEEGIDYLMELYPNVLRCP